MESELTDAKWRRPGGTPTELMVEEKSQLATQPVAETIDDLVGSFRDEGNLKAGTYSDFVTKYQEWIKEKERQKYIEKELLDPCDYETGTVADQVEALWNAFSVACSRLKKAGHPFLDLIKNARFDSTIHNQLLHLEHRGSSGEHVASDMLTHFRTWKESFLKSLAEEDRPYFIRKLDEWMKSTPSHRPLEIKDDTK